MALRNNHYDLAFEEYLREHRLPYVSVDETRRALLHDASLKSMDFIVYSGRSPNLLIDVKGRKFPTGARGHRWENWAMQEDIECLLKWQSIFGAGFRALLVFAYHLCEPPERRQLEPSHSFRNRDYSYFGVWADEYGEAMRRRSPSWETVWLPAQQFHELRSPITDFLSLEPANPSLQEERACA